MLILIICLFGCMAASVVDAFFGGVHLTEAIMISSIFLYMYLRSHDNILTHINFGTAKPVCC